MEKKLGRYAKCNFKDGMQPVQLTFRPNIKSDNPMIRHGQAEKSLTKIVDTFFYLCFGLKHYEVSCTVSGPSIIMPTSYLQRH